MYHIRVIIVNETTNFVVRAHNRCRNLTDHQQIFAGELVERHLQIQRRRPLADATGRIVMGSVARTVVATVFAGVGNWHAAQMCAHAQHDQPLGLLDTLL